MKRLFAGLLLSFLLGGAHSVLAQETAEQARFSVESTPQYWPSGGYSVSGYYYPAGSRLSFGVGLEGGRFTADLAKNVILENGDAIEEIDLTYLARLEVRYHFREQHRGLYAGARMGYEEWFVRHEGQANWHDNAFFTPIVGYVWHPFSKGESKGFLVHPNFGAILIIGRGETRTLSNESYRFRSVLFSPALAVGWKF